MAQMEFRKLKMAGALPRAPLGRLTHSQNCFSAAHDRGSDFTKKEEKKEKKERKKKEKKTVSQLAYIFFCTKHHIFGHQKKRGPFPAKKKKKSFV
jgi:hypothetical protein